MVSFRLFLYLSSPPPCASEYKEANWETVNCGVAVLPKPVTKERVVGNGRPVGLDQDAREPAQGEVV